MRQHKTLHAVYGAWEYRKEIENLNRESLDGWQLIRGGCFYSRFERDEGIVYRYQIDFRGRIRNMPQYLESFRDQGWEYINSTFNGWHFFRKVYDPAMPDEEYEIYTDEESIAQMQGRWRRMAMVIGSVCLVVAIATLAVIRFSYRPWIHILMAAGYFSGAMLLFTGVHRMGRTPRETRRGRTGWLWFIMMMVCFIAAFCIAI